MLLMPRPIRNAPPINLDVGSSGRLTSHSASAEATIGSSHDSAVIQKSYPIGIGSLNASMPMKCIDQIPVPIAIAPPISQAMAVRPDADATRPAMLSAVYDA